MKAMLCLGVLAMLVGCDSSKVDLENAKTTLSNVTRERDDLKVQVASLQQQLTTAKTDLAKEKATEAAAPEKNGKTTMAAKSSPSDSSTTAKSKHAHKS